MSRRKFMNEKRKLTDLVSVGPATVNDLKLLGISRVEDLTDRDAVELYERLCELTGVRHDPCCKDVFNAAIAQSQNPDLPQEHKQWWYWSRLRKLRENGGKK